MRVRNASEGSLPEPSILRGSSRQRVPVSTAIPHLNHGSPNVSCPSSSIQIRSFPIMSPCSSLAFITGCTYGRVTFTSYAAGIPEATSHTYYVTR